MSVRSTSERPPSLLPTAVSGAPLPSPNQDLRSRNKRRDDAIRNKVQQELNRKTKRRSSNMDHMASGTPARRTKGRSGTVASLHPNPPITVMENAKVAQAAQLMAAKRVDAVLAVSSDGSLVGILTDKDISFRVVAEGLDVRYTTVAQVMTRNPISVMANGPRNEALSIMVARRFRHLPVMSPVNDEDEEDQQSEAGGMAPSMISSNGGGTNVVGLLDITKCVFDRLDDLEKKVNEDANIVAAMEALGRRGAVASDHVDAMRSQHGCPDLYAVLESTHHEGQVHVPEISIKSTVRDAAKAMREHHMTAILVSSSTEDDKLGGIFTTKDIVLRVIAAGLDPATTSVVRVMTPQPDFVGSGTTILDALKKLKAGHYLHLPVVDHGTTLGLVDVLTLTINMLEYLMSRNGEPVESGPESGPMWNKVLQFWNTTFAPAYTETETQSATEDSRSMLSHGAPAPPQFYQPEAYPSARTPPPRPPSEPAVPMGISSPRSSTGGQPQQSRPDAQAAFPERFQFKLKDASAGKVFRFQSSTRELSDLLGQVMSKLDVRDHSTDSGVLTLTYEDEDGDVVHLASDQDLTDSVRIALGAGWDKLTIAASFDDELIGGSVAAAAEPDLGGRGVHRRGASQEVARVEETGAVSLMDMLKEAPLPVNVAISAGIVLVTAYIVHRLTK
ncbi:hypothetical protein HK101_007485 [Irineochytrium annulatum]|nr:hypothetical protein HK101_007485 [Irineochytrium annulatum]